MASVLLLTNSLMRGSYTRKNMFFRVRYQGAARASQGDMGTPWGPAGQGLPQPGSIPLPPVRELGRLGGSWAQPPAQGIGQLHGNGHGLRPGWDVSLRVGVRMGPAERNQGQTQPHDHWAHGLEEPR